MYEWRLINALFTGAFIILLFFFLERHPGELFRNAGQKKGHFEEIVHSLKVPLLLCGLRDQARLHSKPCGVSITHLCQIR